MITTDLLIKIDQTHQTMSQAILKVREVRDYGDAFTPEKKSELESEIHKRIGTAQKMMDEIPDHRGIPNGHQRQKNKNKIKF